MKPIKKILAVLLACVMLAALAGCASSSNIQAPAAGAYDFATYWIKDNKLITSVNQSWRIGSAGTTKVTSGDGDGIGAWYAQTMPSAWAFAATVTFDNTGTAAQTATVVFGPDQNTTLLTLTLEFQRNRVRVTTDHNGMQLCRSGWMRANSDGAVKVILDIAQSDGRPRLFLTNPDNQAAGDKTKISFNYKMASLGDDNARLQTFGLGANAAGVSFSYLGVMNNPYQPGKGQIQAMAQQAMNDLMANFWTGTPTDGQFKAKDTDWPLNNSMIWEYGTAMFTVETAWDLTGDPVYKQYIQAQWNYMQKRWTDDAMTRAGQGQPNVAQDDTSWTALTLMTVYRVTGDARALALAAQVARNCFAYFKV
ncbi:MAG: hypothetical protein FWF49_04310, partial [Oscillospiraceae bacterium]|nr:hypothetical protein [Oscillospiraceae bacterium]